MLKVYIGPNGHGKSYTINKEIEDLLGKDKNRKDIIKLEPELVFADEMKDTINTSFVMDHIIQELLETDEIIEARKSLEQIIDKAIKQNQEKYNTVMENVLSLNNQNRTKNVISTTSNKEYKKVVKIDSTDLKGKMGSGQKLQFLLELIKSSKKKYVFLDEPDNHTHPSLLNKTANLINHLSKDRDVCVATHSIELLSMLDIDFDNLYIFNDSNNYSPKKINFNNAIILNNNIHVDNMHSKCRTYYNLTTLKKNIIELHKKEFMEALFSKKVYLVEGTNDELFLKKLLAAKGVLFEQYSIFHCYGKPQFIAFLNIFKSLGIETIALFDEDKTDDNNNMAINENIKGFGKYIQFSDILEKELGYKHKKGDTVSFIEFLEEYNHYDNYFNKI